MRSEVLEIPYGWRGTDATVGHIHRLVKESATDPVVRGVAEDVVRNVPERSPDEDIRAISRFVRSRLRYTNESIETLKTPRVICDEIRRNGKFVGDCDDAVTLWLALHNIIGTPTDIQVISQRRDGTANHIYGRAWNGHHWIADDTIKKNRGLGWEAPRKVVTARKTYMGPPPQRQEVGCYCGGSCSRSYAGTPDGLGVVDVAVALIGGAVSVATTAASIGAQLALQKKADEAQKKALAESRRQFDEQQQAEQDKAAAAMAIAAGMPPPSGDGVTKLALLGALALGAYLILKG